MKHRTLFQCLLFLIVQSYVASEGSQLPQLVNADGSLSNPTAQSMASNFAQGASNAFDQAGQSLSQVPQSIANGANSAYQQGQQYVQQGVDGMKNAANQFGNKLEQFGNDLAEGPRQFLNNVGQMSNQIQTGFDNALKSGVEKLKELQTTIGEKFRPMTDKALEIFGRPGSEKEHWNELVTQVEGSNLTPQEKQEIYQKIANATAPQVNQMPQQPVNSQQKR
ncbi:unnamed protein product [Bursaphelenchus okinawaensis]|uniref:Uncharacterized protein n=1 Tax=Bursaphelenchus okinawaensis TaxID=465554 RepID=A0A811KG43_9BILA|nr:unnamed protein product [Bursaphelenchus okinawaensis]CAG9102459.1 unnamed protein product [Bursaphelenchus okinawaensis]